MNLRDLEYLVAVADHRHFGRAAEACWVSQPTLSTQLRKLEHELGVDLIERGRQVLLTAAGERVVEQARHVLGDVDEIRRIAKRAQDPHSGTVRIGVFPTLAPYLLPHVVPGLRRDFPELELRLIEEKTSVLLDQLHDGRVDAAVLALPVDIDGLQAEPLFREDFVLALPAEHAMAREQGPVALDVLAGERVLLLTDGHCLRDQALSVCQLAGAREMGDFRATSLETLRHMVAAGVGITLLPRLAVAPPVASSQAIVVREFTEPAPSRDIALLWRRTNPVADTLAELARTLRALPDGLVQPL